MNINWICLCVVILTFLYRISAEDCFAKRLKRGSEDATESPAYYIQESSIAEDPMMALYSDQQLIKEESPLATLFKPVLGNPVRMGPGQIQPLHQILNLKALSEIPRTGLRKTLGSPLIKEFSKQPNIIARKNEDLRSSSSNFFAYEARECLANPLKDRILQTPRLADKLKELSEKTKKVFDEKIASSKTKISKFKSYSTRDSKPMNTDLLKTLSNDDDEEEVGYTFTVEHVTKPTPWVVYASVKPRPTEKSEEITEAPSLAEKVKAAIEKNRKAFADAVASSNEKLRKIQGIIRGDPEPVNKDVVYASLEGTLPIEDEK